MANTIFEQTGGNLYAGWRLYVTRPILISGRKESEYRRMVIEA